MRRSPVPLLAAIALLLAACSVGPGAPNATATSSPDPAASTYWLRMTTTQAIAPLELFGRMPVLAITGDAVAVTPGPVAEIYPGPLVPPLIGRRVTEAGRARIVEAARDAGLLDWRSDFTGDALIAGGETGRIELTVDGRRVSITGDPSAHIECITTPCVPASGTPAAFGDLWRQLTDLGQLAPRGARSRSRVRPARLCAPGPPRAGGDAGPAAGPCRLAARDTARHVRHAGRQRDRSLRNGRWRGGLDASPGTRGRQHPDAVDPARGQRRAARHHRSTARPRRGCMCRGLPSRPLTGR